MKISIDTITNYLNNETPLKTRAILSDFVGANITVSGEILGIAKRDDLVRFSIKTTSNGRIMTTYADFDAAIKPELKAKKIKKGSTVNLSGNFKSSGTEAIVINNSYLS